MTAIDPTLVDALRYLAQIERRVARRYGYNDSYLIDWLQDARIERIDESTLEYLLVDAPGNEEIAARGTFLFLPAPEHGRIRIPVLNVLYGRAQTSFQLACFFLDGLEVHAVGYRYETDEQPAQDGSPSMHGYRHAQPSNAIRTQGGSRVLPTPEPLIPDGEPAFPLPARDPVDLLVCLLVSLYGRHQATTIITEANSPGLTARLPDVLSP